ncbi:HTH-type transcriptional repressor Bm3R1 [Poriferisphaera corsica]|uniref:HTH-type transcriptional repressor Bm3R1 n=1 Tax=Poriferisphaera corsica TaxID=2528020 RepID=A0A517YPQ6_9BACT|nr:TetR/AcrR family transcriptional regulator [Poriferisphaera corsica]QDU32217.1 HTH-type transcriptional repressor Bm3R1 [Poriferisphaera corsica]
MSTKPQNININQDGSPTGGARETILDAAEQLFAEKGFSATSMANIAKESGTSKPLIHHHFGSKRGLYDAARERLVGQLPSFEVGEKGDNEGTAEALVGNGLRTLTAFLKAHHRLIRITAWAHLEGGDGEGLTIEQTLIFSLVTERIREAQDAGIVRKDIPPAAMMLMLGGMVYFYHEYQGMFRELLSGENEQSKEAVDDAYLDQMIRMAAAGIDLNNMNNLQKEFE